MPADALLLMAHAIESENGVVHARQRAKRVAELTGFDAQDQTRIATAVSEIARNAFEYAGGGRIEFSLRGGFGAGDGRQQRLGVMISDRGPGIADIQPILEGQYRSPSGIGVGLLGAKRLMDGFNIETAAGAGTTVDLEKRLPRLRGRVSEDDCLQIVQRLSEEAIEEPLTVLAEQNRDLVRSFDELKNRQEELSRVNQELEDTNRGVVALYGELDARAEQLREANELKSRFLSNMTHEFRTPLNSIIALTALLLQKADGDLSSEQERQVGYIRKSAENLAELVNDLLDLGKVEAGKAEVRVTRFTAGGLFGGLRGMLKPLVKNEVADLVFEDALPHAPALETDEAKVAQVLRNLISNALKFTPQGQVRVFAEYDSASDRYLFQVSDTGVGIAPGDQIRVFEDYAQVQNSLQHTAKGTGLGLPLSRRLAELLGGSLALQSALGEGSTFTLSVPRVYSPVPGNGEFNHRSELPEAAAHPKRVLIIDDEEAYRYVLQQMLRGAPHNLEFLFVEASNGMEGLNAARLNPVPDLVLLDLNMPQLDGYSVLNALASDPRTKEVPVVVITSATATPELNARLSHAKAMFAKSSLSRELLVSTIGAVFQSAGG